MPSPSLPDKEKPLNATAQPSCPFCASHDNAHWGVRDGHTMYLCKNCGVVFFPRPIYDSRDYNEYYPYLELFDHHRFQWELQIRRRKYRAQLAVARKLRPGARTLLDVGAGPGYFCRVAAEEGWEALGVETSAPAIEAGRREFGVRYAALDEIEPHSQDVITCHHVLEHIEEPQTFLRSLHSKLRTDGILVVHVPHREPVSFTGRNLLDGLRGSDRDKYCQMYYPEHITGFSQDSLRNALALFGFEPIRMRTAAMWSKYYDPFFLRNYFYGPSGKRLERVDHTRLIRHVIRCAVDNVGVLFGRGDWIVGHFRPKVGAQTAEDPVG